MFRMFAMASIRVVISAILIMAALVMMHFTLHAKIYRSRLALVDADGIHQARNLNLHVSCPIKESKAISWSAKPTKTNVTRKRATETSCHLRAIGGQQKENYGAWTLCETSVLLDSRLVNSSEDRALVYSFGLGRDTSFDEEMIKRYGAIVHGFDPTPGSWRYVGGRAAFLPDCFFALHPIGLNDKDGTIKLYPPPDSNHISHNQVPRAGARPVAATLLRLATIMHLLGHAHVDILKIDIEGAEFGVLESLLSIGEQTSDSNSGGTGDDLPIDQLCVEYHPNIHPGGQAAGVAAIKRITEALRARGFSLVVSNAANEYTYVRLAGKYY